ncbi:unnamed protein product, partial [Closterium sp. NIES-53]
MVDKWSRFTWARPLSKKSDAAAAIKEDWLPMVERQAMRLVKVLRSEQGGEFLGAEFTKFLKKNGIRHQLTCPRTPQQNGIAELANRTIGEAAKTLLGAAGMPYKTVLAGAAVKGWHVKQMDITTAFLNGILLEDIYMAQPDGYEDGTSRVCKLKKAIYDLKQAPRCWYEKLEEVLLSGGFNTSQADHSLFLLGEGEQLLLLLVYVDDILLFSPSMEQIERTQKLLMDNFKCKMLGDVHYYLGLQIERDVERRWLKVHQPHYISGVMERYGVTGGRTVMTPFPAGFKLKKAAEEDDVLEDEQRNEYQSLIGSVMYAAVHTRPDASFRVGQLARVVQRPTEEQLEVAKRLVRYLGSTASAGVQFSAGGQLKQIGADGVTPGTLKLLCFTDATWASEDEDHSSVGDFVCMVG